MSGYRGAGVYVFRTRRPGLLGRGPVWLWWVASGVYLAVGMNVGQVPWAILLIPLLLGPRHFAYVGETNAIQLRKLAHLVGGGKFQAVAKDWADLKPTHYFIPLPGAPKFFLRAVETLLIVLCWPVYNVSKNRWNPRRISLRSAKRQRAQRDLIGWSFNLRPAHAVLWITFAIVAIGRGGWGLWS